jgi:hypothetical protein
LYGGMRSVDAGTIDWIWIRGLKVMQARHMGGFFPWANCVLIEFNGDYSAALMHADTGLQCWCYPLIDPSPPSWYIVCSYPSINEQSTFDMVPTSRPSAVVKYINTYISSIGRVDLAAVTMTRSPTHEMQVENCRARIAYPSLWVYSPVKRQHRE